MKPNLSIVNVQNGKQFSRKQKVFEASETALAIRKDEMFPP